MSSKASSTPGMAEYRFVTFWRMEAPLRDVYDAIVGSLHWPEWWQGAEYVEECESGDADGIGGVRCYTWKSRLHYRLRFKACTTRVEPLCAIEATVTGDLEGIGLWGFCHEAGITTVRYEWRVRTTRAWMNFLAPVARSVFAKNHHCLMQNGAEGLARRLNARLLAVSHASPTQAGGAQVSVACCAGRSSPLRRRRINAAAAVTAGVGAGILATVAQLALWWAFSAPLPDILFRDARLAAAIVMGGSVLPPPSTFDWNVMLVATIVHFALSIGYGLILAPVLSRLDLRPSLLAGAVFGLIVYGVNMYGFTTIFPWFAASRDWITAAAHLTFGIAAAAIYKFPDGAGEA